MSDTDTQLSGLCLLVVVLSFIQYIMFLFYICVGSGSGVGAGVGTGVGAGVGAGGAALGFGSLAGIAAPGGIWG